MNTTADIAEPSQTVRVQLRLRELILGGELKPGARIAELTLVERLNASRTPIRMALVRLQEEGLLEALPHGGFSVKDFSEADIHDAIELRGTLEGLCARLAAERGVTTVLISEARDCVERIDVLLSAPSLSEESFGGYVDLNGRFHDLLAEMSGSDMVRRPSLQQPQVGAFQTSMATGAAATPAGRVAAIAVSVVRKSSRRLSFMTRSP